MEDIQAPEVSADVADAAIVETQPVEEMAPDVSNDPLAAIKEWVRNELWLVSCGFTLNERKHKNP